jgi:hypothetical protein
MVRNRVIAVIALCLLYSAALGEGGVPGAFLNYGIGPRSLGMGKAFTAVADDAEAGYFNPGGLFQMNAQQVLLAHSQLYGARLEYVGYALPTRELGTFAISIINYGSEGLDARTPDNQKYQSYVFAENAFIASYSYNPWSFLGFGANLKLITKNVAAYSDVAFGGDVGALLKLPRPFSFGIVAQNLLQPTMTLVNIPERYPRTLRAGVAARLLGERVTISADLVAVDFLSGTRRTLAPHGGVEFAVVPGVLVPRIGFDANDISLGLGVHKSWGKAGIGADYAFLLHHQSNYLVAPTHKLGMFVSFSGFRVWIDAQPRVFSPTIDDKQNVLWMDVRLLTRAPIKRWQVLVKNSFGEVVRSYGGWETPPLRMTWDGLDDAGRLVSDGRYYYEIVVVDQRNRPLQYSGSLAEIRTRGPKGRMEIRPGQK